MGKSSFSKLIESEKPLLIDFYADWCGPCKALAPVIQELKETMGDRARVIKINVDKNQALSQKLNIAGIPALMIYQNGELKWQASGMQSMHKMKTELEKLL